MERRVQPHFSQRHRGGERSARGLLPIAAAFIFFAWIGPDGFRYWPSLPERAAKCAQGDPKPGRAADGPLSAGELVLTPVAAAGREIESECR